MTLVNNAREKHQKDIANSRISEWRHRVGSSLKEACKWLRGGPQSLTSIINDRGQLLVHPAAIVEEVKGRCSSVFEQTPDAAKRDHFYGNYAHLLTHHELHLQPLDGTQLREALAKPQSAAGPDGWLGAELLVLPDAAWDLLADMFNIVESTQQWPVALTAPYVAAIPKDEHRLRLLGITPQVYRTWARARVQDLSERVKAWIGDDLHGGCQGRSTTTASLDIVLELSRAVIDDEDFCGTSLDYTACFDRVDANLCIQLLVKLGLPSALGDTIKAFYANLQKTVKIGATISSPLASPTGILQGCPFSALLLSAPMVTWVKFARTHVQPEEEINLSVYLGDRHIAAPNAITVAKVLEVSVEFDHLANGILNESKTQIYGTPSSTMTPIAEVMPQAVRVDRVWTLGFALPTGADNGNVDIGKMQARVDKATRVAEKAQHLPHDIRICALESCFPAVLEYGVEFLPASHFRQPSEAKRGNREGCMGWQTPWCLSAGRLDATLQRTPPPAIVPSHTESDQAPLRHDTECRCQTASHHC
ncbi:unnamed protein product [Polarella glacialis]|uniref:Reverse transcriptase domain-containing protein n=1 Tax=Polarella glacialis TaxID=89957 RepID=A0A813EF41_POLGL|nr:unnamed protein product [Polarella glacialis]